MRVNCQFLHYNLSPFDESERSLDYVYGHYLKYSFSITKEVRGVYTYANGESYEGLFKGDIRVEEI